MTQKKPTLSPYVIPKVSTLPNYIFLIRSIQTKDYHIWSNHYRTSIYSIVTSTFTNEYEYTNQVFLCSSYIES